MLYIHGIPLSDIETQNYVVSLWEETSESMCSYITRPARATPVSVITEAAGCFLPMLNVHQSLQDLMTTPEALEVVIQR